ncbi:MAG: ribulose-phosphate 3-epimerase [Planctomycetaceae bacterium]
MIRIAPSLLSADFGRLREEIASVAEGGADWLHLDVMDGHFVPNITFGPFIVESIRKLTDLPLDCHLMIEDPLAYGPAFAKAGADLVTFHVEVPGEPDRTFDAIEKAGAKAGMVVNPATDVRLLGPWIERCALVLVMSVVPGFGGQAFMPQVLEKIPVLKEEMGYRGDVEIDGGISPKTAGAAKRAGADILVAGNAIFRESDRAGAIRRIREA